MIICFGLYFHIILEFSYTSFTGGGHMYVPGIVY